MKVPFSSSEGSGGRGEFLGRQRFLVTLPAEVVLPGPVDREGFPREGSDEEERGGGPVRVVAGRAAVFRRRHVGKGEREALGGVWVAGKTGCRRGVAGCEGSGGVVVDGKARGRHVTGDAPGLLKRLVEKGSGSRRGMTRRGDARPGGRVLGGRETRYEEKSCQHGDEG